MKALVIASLFEPLAAHFRVEPPASYDNLLFIRAACMGIANSFTNSATDIAISWTFPTIVVVSGWMARAFNTLSHRLYGCHGYSNYGLHKSHLSKCRIEWEEK
jgi:hypothetical protein